MQHQHDHIILIGPMGIGKTTVAKKLAAHLSLPYIGCDKMRYAYYTKMPGFDSQRAKELFNGQDPYAYYTYMNPFELMFIERILKAYPHGIFDFGAGHSVYESLKDRQKISKLLAPYRYVIFLRYSKDEAESGNVLSKRRFVGGPRRRSFYNGLNSIYIRSNCNLRLAKYIVSTKGATKEEVLHRILNLL